MTTTAAPDPALALLPRPRRLEPREGVLVLPDRVVVATDAGGRAAAEHLARVLAAGTGRAPTVVGTASVDDGAVTVEVRVAEDATLPAGPRGSREESFRLEVTPAGARVVGGGPAGATYGVVALLQLLPPAVLRRAPVGDGPWVAAACVVEDAPAFAWRGVMLDVARHFFPVHEVLRLVDQLAAHRVNRLHLHLTEDQGWRLEIRRYPRLTQVGAWRRESQVGADVVDPDGGVSASFDGRPHGGFYTHDDVREIVAYAAARGITVVPEIETPGHVRAALAAYPELGVTRPGDEPLEVWTRWGICEDVLNTQEATVRFFQDVLDEVMELFPSEYVGLGGDECPKTQWRADPVTQQRIRDLGLADEEELQGWFVGRLAAHVEAAGRRPFGWDEVLEGGTVPRSTAVMSWRGLQGAVTAARRGHDVVSTPDDRVYLDYRQSELDSEPIPIAVPLTVADVLAFDPVPPELTPAEAEHVLGGQANLWTEHVDDAQRADYQLFPRVAALAEALWSADAAGPRDRADFERRLAVHHERLVAMGVEARPDDGPLPWQQRPGVPGRPASREDRAAHMATLTANITD